MHDRDGGSERTMHVAPIGAERLERHAGALVDEFDILDGVVRNAAVLDDVHIDRHHHGARGVEERGFVRARRNEFRRAEIFLVAFAPYRTTSRRWRRIEARPCRSLAAARRIAHSGVGPALSPPAGRTCCVGDSENPRPRVRRGVSSRSRFSASFASRYGHVPGLTPALSQFIPQHTLEHLAGRIARQLLAQDQLLRHLEGGEMRPAMAR